MQWPEMQQPVTAAIASAVQITVGHLTVLGNAVGGEFATDVALGEDGQAVVNQSPTSPLAARARKAGKLARGLIAMAEGQLEAGGKQPAWMVMRDCLASALTYDARVCSAVHYQPFALQLRGEIIRVASAVAGVSWLGLSSSSYLCGAKKEGWMSLTQWSRVCGHGQQR